MKYGTMSGNPTGGSGTLPTGNISRKGSWARRWDRTGSEVLGCIDIQPCDTLWVRCPEEVQYQIRAGDLCAMMEHAREPWKTFQELPSIIPRTISEWYMFKSRE